MVCAQSFAPWQQATIEIMLAISLTIVCSRYIINGVILHAHPVRGESHNQRNTTGEVATLPTVGPEKSITPIWCGRRPDFGISGVKCINKNQSNAVHLLQIVDCPFPSRKLNSRLKGPTILKFVVH